MEVVFIFLYSSSSAMVQFDFEIQFKNLINFDTNLFDMENDLSKQKVNLKNSLALLLLITFPCFSSTFSPRQNFCPLYRSWPTSR